MSLILQFGKDSSNAKTALSKAFLVFLTTFLFLLKGLDTLLLLIKLISASAREPF